MTGLLVALLITALASPAIDRLVQPAPGHRRGPSAWAIQAGMLGIGLALLLAITQRPAFAAALVLALQLLVVLVNNAKYRALREPFVFTDFGLFSQAIRHPRLYLPFLGVMPALAGTAAFALALYLGLALEPSLLARTGPGIFAVLILTLLALSAALIWVGTHRLAPPALEPVMDVAEFGLLPSLWLYRLAEHRHHPHHPAHPARGAARLQVRSDAPARPHIVAVQSESFFDVRRLYPDVAGGLLERFDAACERAVEHGTLAVPAWGANTMRTEFAFLSGIGDQHLGVHRFNPYRRFARHPWHTLATALREAGYRTVCVHPHPASFFARDRVYPLLGFDEFIDIGAFADAEKFGPYISDAAVTAKVRELLAEAGQPTFLFVITMENHGPLHLEQVSHADVAALYRRPPPAGFDDLTVYLRHLRNADRMIGDLIEALHAMADDAVLCFYGDHVPSMPRVYAASGFEDGRSDYLIWRRGASPGGMRELRAEQLAQRLLEAAGLAGTERAL